MSIEQAEAINKPKEPEQKTTVTLSREAVSAMIEYPLKGWERASEERDLLFKRLVEVEAINNLQRIMLVVLVGLICVGVVLVYGV